MTRQRAILLEVFRSDECVGRHRTADEILALARKRFPAISRATVYNNLKYMAQEGLIRRISTEGGADMYDASYELHAHLICNSCGEVRDVPAPNMLSELSLLCGEHLEAYELKLKYLCASCRAANKINQK